MKFNTDDRFGMQGFVWQIDSIARVNNTRIYICFKVGNPGYVSTFTYHEMQQMWSEGKISRVIS